jgi:predicted RNase H-like HicB family nuclease
VAPLRDQWSAVDGCFLDSIVELERNMTCGQTREEVLANLKGALVSYITTSFAHNMEIPEPLKIKDFKGNITYRTSKERHCQLAKLAKHFGKSINSFIDDAIGDWNILISLPLATSHSLSVVSSEPESAYLPSGLNATTLT